MLYFVMALFAILVLVAGYGFGARMSTIWIAFDRAADEFWEWRRANPGVYLGLSEEGRLLLTRYIEWYRRLRPILGLAVEYDECLQELEAMFFELPPKSPASIPIQFDTGHSEDECPFYIDRYSILLNEKVLNPSLI